MESGGMLTLASTVTSLGTLDELAGTVTYDGGTAIHTDSYYNLTFSSGGTHTAVGTITVAGDLTVSSGTIFRPSNTTVTGLTNIDGTLNIGSSITFTANGSSDIDGTLSAVTSTYDANGTFDATGGSVTFSGAGNLNLGSTVTSLGTLDDATGTVTYDGGTAMFTDTYNNLTISSGNTHSASGTITVNNNLTISSGTFGVGSNIATVSGTSDIDGTLSLSTGTYNADGTFDATNGTIDFTGAGNLVLSSTVTFLGTLDPAEGTVTYDGTTQTIVADNYHKLSIETAGTKTAGGNLDVDGSLNIANTASCVLDLDIYALNLAGDLTVGYIDGLDASDASCIVIFDGFCIYGNTCWEYRVLCKHSYRFKYY